jgi:thioesterase domain-containing protein
MDLGIPLEQIQLPGNGNGAHNADEQVARVLVQAQRQNLLPVDVNASRLNLLFEAYKRNSSAMEAYVPGPYAGRVTLFKAQERIGKSLSPSADAGWGALAAGGVEVHELPGNHYSMIRQPHVRVLAQRLRHCILSESRVLDEV